MILYLIAFKVLLFVSFLGWVWHRYGVQDSISDSWYALEKKHALFTLFLWGIGFSMCVVGGLTENGFYFFSGAFLCFTGAAAEFKQDMTKTVHYVGAVGSIVLAFAGLLINGSWIPLALFVVGAVVMYRSKKVTHKTWWIECLAFFIAEIGILLKYG